MELNIQNILMGKGKTGGNPMEKEELAFLMLAGISYKEYSERTGENKNRLYSYFSGTWKKMTESMQAETVQDIQAKQEGIKARLIAKYPNLRSFLNN